MGVGVYWWAGADEAKRMPVNRIAGIARACKKGGSRCALFASGVAALQIAIPLCCFVRFASSRAWARRVSPCTRRLKSAAQVKRVEQTSGAPPFRLSLPTRPHPSPLVHLPFASPPPPTRPTPNPNPPVPALHHGLTVARLAATRTSQHALAFLRRVLRSHLAADFRFASAFPSSLIPLASTPNFRIRSPRSNVSPFPPYRLAARRPPTGFATRSVLASTTAT